MSFENFLNEVAEDDCKQIDEEIKRRGLPVIIFGAGEMAKWVTENLSGRGINVDGYAVDAEYFKPDKKFLDRPVYNFAELRAQAERYVFVLGMEDEMQGGSRAVNFLRDEQIVSYPLPINLKGSCEKIGAEFIADNRDAFARTYDLLADELSRQTMINFLKLKLTADWTLNLDVFKPAPYFNALTEKFSRGSFVDCGAYCGDTIARFVKWSGGRYEKIFAFEPDAANFTALENFVRAEGYRDVSLFNCGVWHEKSTIYFERQIERTRVDESGTVAIHTEKLDDVLSGENVSLIKMEIQGSELNALRGATEILKNQKPALTIMMFHKATDLITIP